MEIYSVNLRIQFENRKIGIRRNSVFGHFSRSGDKKELNLLENHSYFNHFKDLEINTDNIRTILRNINIIK